MRFCFKSLILTFVFAVVPSVASADALELDAIRAKQATIRAGLEAGSSSPYQDLSPAARAELLSRQTTLLDVINGKQSDSELTDEQRADVAATLAWIDTKLKEAEAERMVCEYRKTIGSNRKQRVCMTAAQMEAQRAASRERMDRRGICDDCSGDR